MATWPAPPPRPHADLVPLGVYVGTEAPCARLPFALETERLSGGAGPSEGFALALAIADLLDPSTAPRQTIAATGRNDEHGNVGAIGGARAKAVSARRAVGDLFLVPVEKLIAPKIPGLTVRGAATLGDARRRLHTAR